MKKKEYDIKFLRLNTIFFINNTLNVKYHSKVVTTFNGDNL